MARASSPANANGHRRRQTRLTVLAEETHCYLCGQLVDKSLGFLPDQHGQRCQSADCTGCIPDPMRAEVDEVIPRALGGSPIDRANCRLTHRACNQRKADRLLDSSTEIDAQPAQTRARASLLQW